MSHPYQIQPQKAHEWCWAAVGVSVEHYFDPESKLTQCQLATKILEKPDACSEPPQADADLPAGLDLVLRELGSFKKMKSEAIPFETLVEQIDAGFPVCARIGWSGENQGHFIVLCGCPVSSTGEQWVDVADPFFPASTVPYEVLLNSYQGLGQWTDTYLVKQPAGNEKVKEKKNAYK